MFQKAAFQNKFIGFLITLIFSSQAFAWGAKGHQIVSFVGAKLTSEGQSFWDANAEGMRQLSTVPDRKWKSLPTASVEKPTHWFQADAYVNDVNGSDLLSFPKSYSDAVSKYGENVIVTNGTAPWRIRQFYALAVEALKSNNQSLALQYAGVMSHYVGDLSQPLHVSENYDGQKTGNSGIHSYFETAIIVDEMGIRSEVSKRTEALLNDSNFTGQFTGDLSEVIYLEVSRSLRQRDEILKVDSKLGRTAKGAAAQLNIAEDRMADGAATLSLILSRMWKDAGVTLNASPSPIKDPNWVAPDYANLKTLDHPSCNPSQGLDDDDCQQQ